MQTSKKKYTLREFFDKYPIKQVEVSKRAGIHPVLFRQYVTASKPISEERLKLVEKIIHEIGCELLERKLISK